MNKKFSNLKEVSDYAHSLIRDKSEKELKKLDPLELLEWFIASQRFVAEKAVEIIKNVGINVEHININVACFWYDRWGAYCEYNKQRIIIGTQCLFACSYNGLVAKIIHELTHLEVWGHNDNFWQRYLEILKIEGFADPGLTVEDAFYKDTITVYRHPTEKLPLLRNRIFSENSIGVNPCEISLIFDKKYHQIRRNPIFGRDNWRNIRRLNDIDFNQDVIQLCKEYEVNYNALYRLSHYDISLPEFVGIDKQWNPYAAY